MKIGLIKLINYIPKKFKQKILSINYSLNKTFLKKYLPLNSLYIEITSCCNLKCKGCYRTLHNYESKNKYMSLENFKKYVDQSPRASSLYLYGLGEPTLHPKIKEIVKYAAQSLKFNNIAFTTNALAKNPEIFDELFSKGLTQVVISVDSLISKEVNKMRPITDIKKLAENIKLLLEKFPEKIKISMVVNKINFNTFEKTIKELYDLGLKEISFQPYDDLGYSEMCLSIKEKKEFLERLKNLKTHMKFYPNEGFKSSNKDFCKQPSTAPVINVNGYLTPCCRIYDEQIFNAGNLKNKTFKEIFFSKKYSKIQNNIGKGIYPSFCKGCRGNHLENKSF
jgi:MoaA/NifB/PqqE/SkfB family radical SAM enzyme